MNPGIKTIVAAAALALVATQASADIVELTWVTTVLQASGVHPSIAGESLTTTIRVDNGGSSLASQSWSGSDFLSYRQQGASGWFLESSEISLGGSSGIFSTDASGNVLTAGNWVDGYPIGTVTTSWDGTTLGGWWNNGRNETSCVADPFACVWANNVGENQRGSSWTAALADGTSVPEPATLALVFLGLAGVGMARRRNS